MGPSRVKTKGVTPPEVKDVRMNGDAVSKKFINVSFDEEVNIDAKLGDDINKYFSVAFTDKREIVDGEKFFNEVVEFSKDAIKLSINQSSLEINDDLFTPANFDVGMELKYNKQDAPIKDKDVLNVDFGDPVSDAKDLENFSHVISWNSFKSISAVAIDVPSAPNGGGGGELIMIKFSNKIYVDVENINNEYSNNSYYRFFNVYFAPILSGFTDLLLNIPIKKIKIGGAEDEDPKKITITLENYGYPDNGQQDGNFYVEYLPETFNDKDIPYYIYDGVVNQIKANPIYWQDW